jgi:indole-3-glycerol phosphate synthase
VQGVVPSSSWTFPGGTLGELTLAAGVRANAVIPDARDIWARAQSRPAGPSFRRALRGDCIKLIAEVKRASPSKGSIAAGLDAARQGALYEAGGAAAISVLTEPARFGGSLHDLEEVTASVGIPTLRKDFIVHPVQLWEARAAGASAALLIVRALAPGQLEELLAAAADIGLDALVEVRDEHELGRALAAGARIVGVNNRNLETLLIDTSNAPRVIRQIPGDIIAVAESGIAGVEDIGVAAHAGADAILVGSVISASTSVEATVRALTGVPRTSR